MIKFNYIWRENAIFFSADFTSKLNFPPNFPRKLSEKEIPEK